MEEIEHNPSGIHSFLVNNVLDVEVVDLSKKRKLLDKQLSLPIRKLKFRDGSSKCDDSFPFVRVSDAEDVPQIWIAKVNSNPLRHDSESTQQGSEMDSNSFVEESDCGMSHCIESKSEPEFRTHDQPANSKVDFIEVYAGDKPSTSSGSCGSNSSKDVFYPLDSQNLKKLHIEGENASHLLEFGYHTDYNCSDDHETGENEEFMDDESEDPLLYSKAISSDLFVLSSGRWQIKPDADAQAGIRKPTIDQEFEQYFSSLML